MLNIIKGLPLSYSKDLQDDKQIIFNSYDNVSLCIKVMNEILSKSTFKQPLPIWLIGWFKILDIHLEMLMLLQERLFLIVQNKIET